MTFWHSSTGFTFSYSWLEKWKLLWNFPWQLFCNHLSFIFSNPNWACLYVDLPSLVSTVIGIPGSLSLMNGPPSSLPSPSLASSMFLAHTKPWTSFLSSYNKHGTEHIFVHNQEDTLSHLIKDANIDINPWLKTSFHGLCLLFSSLTK